jgi:hypothetical protein
MVYDISGKGGFITSKGTRPPFWFPFVKTFYIFFLALTATFWAYILFNKSFSVVMSAAGGVIKMIAYGGTVLAIGMLLAYFYMDGADNPSRRLKRLVLLPFFLALLGIAYVYFFLL